MPLTEQHQLRGLTKNFHRIITYSTYITSFQLQYKMHRHCSKPDPLLYCHVSQVAITYIFCRHLRIALVRLWGEHAFVWSVGTDFHGLHGAALAMTKHTRRSLVSGKPSERNSAGCPVLPSQRQDDPSCCLCHIRRRR